MTQGVFTCNIIGFQQVLYNFTLLERALKKITESLFTAAKESRQKGFIDKTFFL